MVLKRQLPSRVAPDEAAAPSAPQAAPAPGIDQEWPAPPAETAAAPAPEIPAPAYVPPLPPLPPVPEVAAAPALEAKPEQTAVPEVPAAPAEPSLPGDSPRRRVKAPRAFTETPVATPAAEAAPLPPVANPIGQEPARLADAGLIAPKVDPLTAANPPSAAQVEALPEAPVENIFALPPEPVKTTPAAPEIKPEPALEMPPLPPVPENLPEPTSDLPWAAENKTQPGQAPVEASGWDIETPAAAPAHAAEAPQPPADVFRDVAASRAPEGPIPGFGGNWGANGGGNGHRPPPELPSSSISSNPRGGSFQLVLAAAAVAGVLFVAYTLVTRTDSTQERLARLTGSLRETPEVVAGSPSSTNPAVQPSLQPEQVIAMGQNGQVASGTLLPPPAVAGGPAVAAIDAGATFKPLEPVKPGSGTVIDFTDVPASEAGKPIVADGTEKMPQDVGFIASLQQAIAKEKAKEGQPAAIQEAEAKKPEDKNLTPEQKLQRGADLKAQLDEELASYRKALAEAPAPALAPKPTEFFAQPKAFMDGQTNVAATASGTLLPPPAQGSGKVAARGNVEGLPPAELYANNPKNLPVLAEPAAVDSPPKVRQLSDFDVNVFEPETPKVRMPKGIRPQISAGDFPALDILSLVPGRGLIAFYEGKEGVLMIGEKVAGWQLVGVNATSAEFASGQRHQSVRPD